MSRIVFQNGVHQGMSIEVDKKLSLGRDLNSDVHLVSPDVSRTHCYVYLEGSGVVLEDAGSRNGSFVNGVQISRQLLKHNDIISLGDLVLKYEQPAVEIGIGSESSVFVDPTFDENNLEMSIAMEGINFLDLHKGGDLAKKLEVFYTVANAVAEQPKENLLFKVILECLFDIFPQAGRGFILKGENEEELKDEAIHFRNQEEGQQKQLVISKTVKHMVMAKKEAVLCKDTQADDGFAASMSIIEEDIHSFMCVPLISMDIMYGLIQIETSDSYAPFEKEDLDLLVGVASLTALFLRSSHSVRTATQESNKRAQLARFFSPKVAENVMNNKLELGGETRYGSVLFCDIVGFTSMSEKITAAELVDRLNQYFEVMVSIILNEQGTVDKFGGDSILSVWGAPEAIKDDSLYAITAALQMQNAIVPFNLDLIKRGADPLSMGIGIHSGKFIAGNIGSKDRMEYTIIGDDVNTAKRVESTASGHMLMVSEPALGEHKSLFYGTRFNPIPLKGKSQPLPLTCIRGKKCGEGYLVTFPCEVEGEFSKIYFVDDSKKKLKLVTNAPLSEGQEIDIKLILPEKPNVDNFSGKVSAKLSQDLMWELECENTSYIGELLDNGIIVVEEDISWDR
ncbi:MAG: hypothetical protein COA79_05320 [Planctomycetota bacterium]|nr:MAG: hypothetical protein COA79_05320 [Planctomycetota bacterium]